ncbi:efflux RND transporter permease subunit [candidate division KSB1 bacterium]
MNIAELSVRNSVLVNILMVVIIVVGAYSMFTIPQELMPDISFYWVFIVVPYPGISPQDVEQLVTIPIEDEISQVDDIDQITSTSAEGGAFLMVQFEEVSDTKFDKLLQDLRAAVDRADIPDDTEDPVVEEFSSYDFMPMISVVLYGDVPEREMRKIAEDLRDDIIDLKGIAQVEMAGVRDREIWVEVDPGKLETYDLTLAQVIGAIQAQNLNVPGGRITVGRTEYLLRTLGEFDQSAEVGEVIVRQSRLGHHLKVKDLARVSDTFEERKTLSRMNGEPSVTLNISKTQGGHTIDLIREIKEIAAEYERERLPDGASVTFINDTSTYIVDILSRLKNNAAFGMLVVVAVLMFILGWKMALFATLGMVLTFLMTFIVLYFTGRTLNGNSLFALVLVLGIVVDDAIIILENCFRYIQKGHRPVEAAIIGTREVAAPVTATILTTIAAFSPAILMTGIMGRFMEIIPIVVIIAVSASLFEALAILPAHIAEWSGTRTRVNRLSLRMMGHLRRRYRRTLSWIIRRRYWAFGVISLCVLTSPLLIFWLGVSMFAEEEISQFTILVRAPAGTDLEAMDKIILKVESAAMDLPSDELESVVANTGIYQDETDWLFQSDVGQVIVDLVEERDRERKTADIIAELRGKLELIAGIQDLRFYQPSGGPPTGTPVEVRIQGKYFDEMEQVAELVKAELRTMPGVFDIRDDFELGKKELRIDVDIDRAAMFGLSVAQIALAVRQAFEGTVATKYRDGDEEIDVLVKFEESARNDLASLTDMTITAPNGALVPFGELARIDIKQGYVDVERFERERSITVTADVDARQNSAIAVNQELGRRFQEISKRFPGNKLRFGGVFEQFEESFKSLGLLFFVALGLVYVILGGQFKSFIQPFIIMFSILFAGLGAMFGLLVSQSPFSITTLFGIMALSGIAVNDSLVMVNFINNARRRGAGRWRSIIESGVIRFRPILLTSLTTIGGLLPMSLGIGGKSITWGPLATTIIWGLLFATFMTLFMIPSIYAIMDDIKIKFFNHKGLLRKLDREFSEAK